MSTKLSPPVKKSTMDYVTAGIRYVCENFKNRSPGSQAERDSQEYFAKELRQWADEVTVEEFNLHPNAFMGFIPISGIIGIIATAFFVCNIFVQSIVMPVIAFVLLTFAVLMLVFEFFLYRQFVDFLFPKAVSKNVYAVRKPKGEVKRRIIFGGHADAAWEWTYALHGQKKTLAPVIFGSIGGLVITFFSDLVYIIMGAPEIKGVWAVIAIVQLILIPLYIAISFFINWKVIVDGANDNLTACYASMAILKEMKENDFRFENTEVGCLITGSEEAGLRGAKAFTKIHSKELNKIETVVIPLETLRETEHLLIYNIDETGMVHNDEAVADLLVNAGKNIGFDLKRAPVYFGSTDAAAMTQAGFHSAGLGGVNHDPQKYYHTRLDSWDNISPECIQKGIEISMETAYLFDSEGLK